MDRETALLQITQLDAMLITAFKADPPPDYVRASWDRFILSMKVWKGVASDEERTSISSGPSSDPGRIPNNGDSIGS
jgi:hypothetical protein